MPRKKKRIKHHIRFMFAFMVFGAITAILGYNLLSNIIDINKMKIEKRELQDKIVDLEKEKEVLETDILKLKDPDYIAKYVREKYFYSKDGELILKIDE